MARRARNSGLPPSRMSVPRPAMLVAMVTAPTVAGLRDDFRLALAWFFAFSTSCSMPRLRSMVESISLVSTETVPTRIG